jgi:hypothetical protein
MPLTRPPIATSRTSRRTGQSYSRIEKAGARRKGQGKPAFFRVTGWPHWASLAQQDPTELNGARTFLLREPVLGS